MYSAGLYSDLKSLNDSGTPPKTRIKDAIAVRNMWSTAYRAYEKRHKKNALVQGLIDGNPPWPDKTKDAQRYKANINNGEGYAYLETAVTAFYDVYSEPETYATITSHMKDPMAQVWAEKATMNFDWLQRQDDAMDYNHQLSIGETVKFGIGPQCFLRQMDWRSSAIPQRTVYVSDDTKSNVSDWEWVIFQFDYGVNELYDFIADEDTARMQGWDVEQVKQSIMRSRPVSWSNVEWNIWERWQQALRDNDIYLGSQCAKVRVARMLFKEFSKDGGQPKITECWVDLDGPNADFLMHKEGQYEDMREAVCAFYYDRGDGRHQSVKGLGVKMYPLLTMRMRLQNLGIDAACMSSTVFATSNTPAGRQTMANINFGALTIFPAGMQLQQANLQGLLEPALAMSNEMGRTLDNNLSQYRQRMDLPEGNPPTKFQVQAQLAQSATLGKTQLARYYQQLDELYTEKFRRASNTDIPKATKNKWLKLALEFQKKCEEDGIPKEFYKNCCVKATRIAGQGSPFMREQSLNQIYATLFPALPEDGKEALVRDMISASVGPALTNRYWNKEVQDPRSADQIWQAQIENDAFYDGGDLIKITPQQNDTLHLNTHFPFMLQALESLQQGGDPAEVFNTVMTGRAHSIQHLLRLSQNPSRKGETETFRQLLQQLDQGIQELQSILTQQAQEQAQQQQALAEAQGQVDANTLKVQSKIELDRIKTAATLEKNQAKTQQQMALTDAKTAQAMKIQQLQTAQKLSHDQATFEQEVTRQAIANAGLIAKQQIENQKPQAGE